MNKTNQGGGTVIIGEYQKQYTLDSSHVRLQFFPHLYTMNWDQCSILADYFASYFAICFPEKQHKQLLSTISYLVNELFENVLKFNVCGEVNVAVTAKPQELIFLLTNQLEQSKVENFSSLLQNLISQDPLELMMEKVEENFADEASTASGLGLLSLMADYGATFGWQFVDNNIADTVTVKTMARLPIE